LFYSATPSSLPEPAANEQAWGHKVIHVVSFRAPRDCVAAEKSGRLGDDKTSQNKLLCFPFYHDSVKLYQVMLRYAIIFLIIALVAEALGAGGVAGEAAWIAHVLLVIALIFIVISFVSGRRGPPAV
jgi:uncharacterized membrane protein YtjA (UPF0391 family)